MKRQRSGRRGSATVELAILLPAYALVVLGALYFGYGWLTQQEGFEASHYAAHTPGNQTGQMSELFFKAYDGEPELNEYPWGEGKPPWWDEWSWTNLHRWRGDVFIPEDSYSGNDWFDFHDIFVELSYTFWGGFVLEGGDLVWRNEGGLNSTGKYIQQHEINELEQRLGMAWMMNGWVVRTSIGTQVIYDNGEPFYVSGLNTSPGPAGGEVITFRPPGENEEGEPLSSVTDALLRGEKQRPLLDVEKGVSTEIFTLIEENFDDYEIMPDVGLFDTEEFWEQGHRPDIQK
ncbi:MAG: TadE family protein [Planctomycetota bacterium]|jgi:hypothetical protein